jgi:hypothetical protein
MLRHNIGMYEQLFDSLGFGIIDNSFLTYRVPKDFFKTRSSGKRARILDGLNAFYEEIRYAIPLHLAFPSETIGEFDHYTNITLKKWASWAFGNGMPLVEERLEDLMETRQGLSNQVLKNQRLESYFDGDYAKSLLPDIRRTFSYIASLPGIVRNNGEGLHKHRKNDGEIASKSFLHSLLYGECCLLTRDWDLQRIFEKLKEEPDLVAQYGLISDSCGADVVMGCGERFLLYSSCGFEMDLETAIAA